MRALFVSTTVPYPLSSGGNQRIYHLLKSVSTVCDVTFVCPLADEKEREALEKLQPFYEEAFVFPQRSFDSFGPRSSYRPARWAGSFLKYHSHPKEPALLRWYRTSEGASLVAELLRRRFDLVWIENLISLQLLPERVDARVICDLHDVQYRKLGHRLRYGPVGPLLPLDLLEWLKLRRLELGLSYLPYEFCVCSHRDREALGRGGRVWVVPNGVDIPPSILDPAPNRSAPTFALVGTMNTEANVDSAQFFVRRVFPRIRRALPEARCVIVGSDPSPAVRRLGDEHGALITGTVPEVEPYLRDACATVVPIRFGGGTRLKILTAMACGVPVVSTTVGAEGLDVEDGKHLLLADRPSRFADACVRLVSDPSLGRSLAGNGFELARARYDWNAIERHVQAIVAGVPGESADRGAVRRPMKGPSNREETTAVGSWSGT